jgi:ATP-dependent exoDNAse (exonuclease V) beta subunit
MDRQEIIATIERINEERFKELNGRSIISVTKIPEYVSTPFDKEGQAKACEQKGKEDPNYKYAGMTAAEIIESWDNKSAESRRYGSLADEYTEQRFEKTPEEMEIWKLDNNFDYDERLKGNCIGFEEFVSDLSQFGYEYVGREITVYGETDKGNVVIGRIDCLFQHPEQQKFLVVDWKTTDEIKTESWRDRRMKGPAYVLQDCDLSKYAIQVQTYVSDLIKTYGLTDEKHIGCAIVNLRKTSDGPGGKHYIVYKPKNEFSHQLIADLVDFSVNKRRLEKMIAEKEKASGATVDKPASVV